MICRLRKLFDFSALLGFVVSILVFLSACAACQMQPHDCAFTVFMALPDSSGVDFDAENSDGLYAQRALSDSVLARAYRPDSVRLRAFNDDALAHLRTQEEFTYDRPPLPPSLWDVFKHWLLKQMSQLFKGDAADILENAIYAISVAIVIFLALKLMNIDLRGLFYSTKKLHGLEFRQEELLTVDELSHLIADAVSKKDYRRAVRYLFLRALKDLAAQGLIVWRIDKTNRDYVHELKRPDLKSLLADLARLFEHVWYGEFELSDSDFLQVTHAFETFSLQLRTS